MLKIESTQSLQEVFSSAELAATSSTSIAEDELHSDLLAGIDELSFDEEIASITRESALQYSIYAAASSSSRAAVSASEEKEAEETTQDFGSLQMGGRTITISPTAQVLKEMSNTKRHPVDLLDKVKKVIEVNGFARPKGREGLKQLGSFQSDDRSSTFLYEVKMLGSRGIGDTRLICLWNEKENQMHACELTDHKGVSSACKSFSRTPEIFMRSRLPEEHISARSGALPSPSGRWADHVQTKKASGKKAQGLRA